MTRSTTIRTAAAAAVLLALLLPLAAFAQDGHEGHNHPPGEHNHDHGPTAPVMNPLSDGDREIFSRLAMQDFRGRMKPVDTYVRELSMKVTKRENFEEWEPADLYLSWVTNPRFWFNYPLLSVRFPGVKDLLGVSAETKWVSLASLLDQSGRYRLTEDVREALRTPDRDRNKVQRKLLKFDERAQIFNNAMGGGGVRLFPVPGDPNNTWVEPGEFGSINDSAVVEEYERIAENLFGGYAAGDMGRVHLGLESLRAVQERYGSAVLPSSGAVDSELWLNRSHPFRNVTMPYLAAFVVLIIAFFWNLGRMQGEKYSFRHPLYLIGSLLFWGSTAYMTYAYVLRWIASGRAPLSNGYESLIFIALATAFAGIIFEVKDRRGSSGGVSALLTTVILSVAMLSTFDPAIGPLVPVLASYWLNIHVTIITGSYGFLGLGSLLGGLTLILLLFKGPGRPQIRAAIQSLDRLHFTVLVTGLGLLSIGTLLGGVWANESWGRYWGWDPKETWSLVTILVYAIAIHFRWIPSLNRPWVLAASGFAGIASVVMTYFGVNYFLSGLHSYAQGDAAKVPDWVFIGSGIMLALILASWLSDRFRSWEAPKKS